MNNESHLKVLQGGKSQPVTRTLPHSAEAEEYLISCCLLDGVAVVAKCRAAGIRPDAFSIMANKLVFERLTDMQGRGVPMDAATLAEELKAAKQLDEIGGYNYLLQVSKLVPTTVQVAYFIETVKYLWEMRNGIRLATQFIEDMYSSTDGREGLQDRSSELGQRLITFGRRTETRTLAERVGEVRASVAVAAEGKQDKSRWLYTGLPTVDATFGPLGSGDEDHFIGLPGASSSGKSALLRQCGHNMLKAGKRVLAYTRETTIRGWIKKAAAQHCGVDLLNLERTPRVDLKRFDEECEWLASVAGKLFFLVQNETNTPLMFVEDLVSHYNAFENLNGPVDCVMVDYLQLFGTKMRTQKREEVVAHVSHLLQGRCREAGNVWMVAAQMNLEGIKDMRTIRREPPDKDGRPGKVIHRLPREDDIRESQAFNQDADRMMYIYRPPVTTADEDQDNLAPGIMRPEQWLVLGKRREGPLGVVKCWFEKRFTRFAEFSREECGMEFLQEHGGPGPGKSAWAPEGKKPQ